MKKLIPLFFLASIGGAAYAQMPSPDEIMEMIDNNKDGVLTKDEAAPTRLMTFFDNIDGDKDGKITLDELKVMAANGPGGAPPAPPAPPAAK